MGKIFTSLGLMSGTSGDGVDASLISSDGLNKYRVIFNQYFKFDQKTQKIAYLNTFSLAVSNSLGKKDFLSRSSLSNLTLDLVSI